MSNDFADLGTPSVQAEVQPQTAKLGDLLTLTVRVTHPAALSVQDPALAKSLGTFEVYASTRMPSEVSGDQAIDQFRASLQNFTTGQQTLPGLEVPYRDPLGHEHSVKTLPITITIEEVPPGPKDKGDIRGLKGVIGPTAVSPWWWLLVLGIAAGACYALWDKRQRAIEGPPPVPPVPPDILALEKLRALGQSDWITTGKTKEYYSAISDIVRGYVEGQFRTPALERTTSELMRDLRKKTDIPTDSQTELRELLENSDLVKFAKFLPDSEESAQTLETAIRFVEKTRPRPETP